MPDLVAAKKFIEDAAAQCVLAAQLADRHAAYVLRRDGEVASKKAGLDGEDVLVKHEMTRVNLSLKDAADAAVAQTYSAASAALDKALVQIAEIAAAKDRRDQIKTRLTPLKERLTQVGNTAQRTGAPSNAVETQRITAEHAAIKLALETAPTDLDALDKRLAKAQADCEALKARAMLSGSTTTPGEVKSQMEALMKQSGGEALLDKLIAGMGTSDNPEHVLAALEVRFKLTAGAKDEGGTSKAGIAELKRVYALMIDVPAKHTKDNPRFKQVTRKPSGGSAYGGGNMTLGDGPGAITLPRAVHSGTGTPAPNCLGNPNEVPDVDPECKLDPMATAPKFFDWNVQHEIGHALDDRKNFMSTRAGNAEFGAWEDHGGDMLGVATAAAAAFALTDVTAEMIAKYLDNGTEPATPPSGWITVKTWAGLTTSNSNPWDKGALCTQSAASGGLLLGTRVYHQAYPSHWFSYAAAARKQGITGYQFRSPGEWFSELYAAYKSKVLQSSHPANTWLDKLFGKKA